jgi:DNA modification methylase
MNTHASAYILVHPFGMTKAKTPKKKAGAPDTTKGRLMVGSCLEKLKTLADCSIDSIVTDPPYELGFMGKSWDASGIAYNVELWRECLRVLKPGGHLLAFGATRTYHRMAVAIEDAGFEIRDSIHWVYGSGFPKSLDVSKAIDKQRHDRADIYKVTTWMKKARDAAGVSSKHVSDAMGLSTMAAHWFDTASQPAIPTLDQVPQLLDVLGVTTDEVPEDIRRLLWDLNGKKGQPGENWAKREVLGTKTSGIANKEEGPRHIIGASKVVVVNVTAPATDAAKTWQGWGTALKPAHEPIVVARKPLTGTVAANVLAHGTGALNIDGCRVGASGGCRDAGPRGGNDKSVTAFGDGVNGHGYVLVQGLGRWPANIIFDEAAGAELDAQSGLEASRFFYCPKPGKAERNAGLEGLGTVRHSVRVANDLPGGDNPRNRTNKSKTNFHPTVKPLALMRYLVRLVTPPGGIVLDPFLGSGTTAMAATLEGFDWLGCELTKEYVPIIRKRVAWAVTEKAAEAVKAQTGTKTPKRKPKAAEGQTTLFES